MPSGARATTGRVGVPAEARQPQLVEQLLTAVEESAVRLEGLAGEAERLEVLAAETDAGREELVRERRELAERGDELALQEAELRSERERIAAVAKELSLQRLAVERARSALEQEGRALDEREAAFASRWRWLLRIWTWRPRGPGAPTRLCEFLFVPTGDGYRLLEQEGVALRRGSRLTGLLGEERAFVVSKLAPWSFDGRWCAYLQET